MISSAHALLRDRSGPRRLLAYFVPFPNKWRDEPREQQPRSGSTQAVCRTTASAPKLRNCYIQQMGVATCANPLWPMPLVSRVRIDAVRTFSTDPGRLEGHPSMCMPYLYMQLKAAHLDRRIELPLSLEGKRKRVSPTSVFPVFRLMAESFLAGPNRAWPLTAFGTVQQRQVSILSFCHRHRQVRTNGRPRPRPA